MAKDINLPVIVSVNYNKLEQIFKILIKKIILSEQFKSSELADLNSILRKKIIIGMEKVNFEKSINKNELNEFIDELWSKFEREFKLKIMVHRKNLEKGK